MVSWRHADDGYHNRLGNVSYDGSGDDDRSDPSFAHHMCLIITETKEGAGDSKSPFDSLLVNLGYKRDEGEEDRVRSLKDKIKSGQ